MAKKVKALDARIKDLLKEGPLVALYFSTGILCLKEQIDKMSDNEVYNMFHGLFNPQKVRNNVDYLFKDLHP